MDKNEIISLAGGTRAVAERLGISTQAVYKWKRVPAEHATLVAKMAKVRPRDVREDVFA